MSHHAVGIEFVIAAFIEWLAMRTIVLQYGRVSLAPEQVIAYWKRCRFAFVATTVAALACAL